MVAAWHRRLLTNQGYFAHGLVPLGYKRQEVKGAQGNALVIDEKEADTVREMFRMSIKGNSVTDVANLLGSTRDRVFSVLRNRSYLGETKNSSGQCTTRFLRVTTAEEQCDPLVVERFVELVEELRASSKTPKKVPKTEAADVAVKLAKLDAKRTRYVEMYADGVMTRTL